MKRDVNRDFVDVKEKCGRKLWKMWRKFIKFWKFWGTYVLIKRYREELKKLKENLNNNFKELKISGKFDWKVKKIDK